METKQIILMNQAKSVNIHMDIEKLSKMLGSQQYENAFSFIQEAAQNGIDSHRLIGSEKSIKVTLGKGKTYLNDLTIQFRDFGKSFEDIEDFEKKVCTLLYSDKSSVKTNDENEVMGKWGIGSISPARYTASNKRDRTFKYTVYKNSRGFTATLEEREGKGLTYEFSEYFTTTEENGVLLEVPFNRAESDLFGFIDVLKHKLSYFENIVFEFNRDLLMMGDYRINESLISLNKNEIVKGKHFTISNFNNYSVAHLLIDQYIYPIDYDFLGIRPVALPIALNFKMNDGLEPNVTRERIFLTPEYKTIILKKIQEAKQEILERFNAEYSDLQDLNAYQTTIFHSSNFCFKELPSKFLSLEEISKTAKYTYKGGNYEKIIRNFPNILSALYQKKYHINNSIRDISTSWRGSSFYPFNYNEKYIVLDQSLRMKNNEKEYYRSKCQNHFIISPLKRGSLKRIMTILGIDSASLRREYFKNNLNIWRKPIEDVKFILSEFEKYKDLKKYSNIEFPKVQKTVKRKIKSPLEEGEILFKKADPWSGSRTHLHCAFNDLILRVDKMSSHSKIMYYGTKEDIETLDKLGYAFENHIFAHVTQKAKKFLDENNFQNIKHFSKFMDVDFPAIKEYATANKIRQKFDKIERSSLLIGEVFGEEKRKKIEKIKEYLKNVSYEPNRLSEEILKMAEEKNMYDYKTEALFEELERDYENVKSYENLSIYLKNVEIKEILVTLITNQMKRDHYRINPKFYKIKNEEKINDVEKEEQE